MRWSRAPPRRALPPAAAALGGGVLLERMIHRDMSPASLAFALPLQRRIAEATAETERALRSLSAWPGRCAMAGRLDEAEPMLRDVITRAALGNFRTASVFAGELLNLLREGGRLEAALKVAEEKAGYTRQAGLGPWTQFVDEGIRLQVLNSMGRYDEVLTAVESLRPRDGHAASGRGGPTRPSTPGTYARHCSTPAARPPFWRTLGDGAGAKRRGCEGLAGARCRRLEVARTRFNDYGPLLRLSRYEVARALLMAAGLSSRPSVLSRRWVRSTVPWPTWRTRPVAGLRPCASRSRPGLQIPDRRSRYCAISHHNLAIYLKRQGADSAAVLAHRLAAAVIRLQMQSGGLPTTLRNLAISDLPPTPPAFADVVERVEAVEGVRFRALFGRLPRTAPDGDAAIAAVWQMVLDEKRHRAEESRMRCRAGIGPRSRAGGVRA